MILKNILLIFSIIIFTGFNNAEKGIDEFSWLLGKWEGIYGESRFTENWKSYDKYTLTGEGVFLNDNDTVLIEQLQIHFCGKHWAYIASVGSAPPILFTLIEQTSNKLVFENKEHDFPQKITYTKISKDSIVAVVEGFAQGEYEKEEYRLKRKK